MITFHIIKNPKGAGECVEILNNEQVLGIIYGHHEQIQIISNRLAGTSGPHGPFLRSVQFSHGDKKTPAPSMTITFE